MLYLAHKSINMSHKQIYTYPGLAAQWSCMYVEERGQSEILRESRNYHFFVMKLIFWLT